MSDVDTCGRCDGCGRIWGDADNEVPLNVMTALPYQSAVAGLTLYPPRACPDCLATGHTPEPRTWEKLSHHVEACPVCDSKSLNHAENYCEIGKQLFGVWLAACERRKRAAQTKGETDGNV